MKDIYERINKILEENLQSWVVTVITSTGSTPAAIGMKMIVYPDGKIEGTIGGGEIEKKIIERIVSDSPEHVDKWSYNLGTDNKDAEKTNMECGGIQEVLVEPLMKGSRLYIVGGGHCGIALSSLASKTGFAVTVIDNRDEWASKIKHPSAVKTVCVNYEEISKKIPTSPDSFVVIMTHGHIHDQLVLEQLINKKFKYIGMIGSERKVKLVFENLLKKGIKKENVLKVFAPLGFDIISHTPDEIAVSIVGQMIAVKNGLNKVRFNSNPLL